MYSVALPDTAYKRRFLALGGGSRGYGHGVCARWMGLGICLACDTCNSQLSPVAYYYPTVESVLSRPGTLAAGVAMMQEP